MLPFDILTGLMHVPCTIQSSIVRLPLGQEEAQKFQNITRNANNAAY